MASKEKFPSNTNMEFTIVLPERIKLGDWKVCLKSLILPSKIWNVYDETMSIWAFQTHTNLEESWIILGYHGVLLDKRYFSFHSELF